MEFRDYYSIFRRSLVLIVVLVVLGTGITIGVLTVRDPGFDSSVALTVNRVNTQDTSDYKYDQFYSLNAVDIFSKSVVAWVDTPSLVDEIFIAAGLPVLAADLQGKANFFDGTKLGPQVIEIRYNSSSEEDAKRIGDGIDMVLQQQVEKLNGETAEESVLTLETASAVVVPASSNLALGAIVSFAISLFIALNLALGLSYIQKKPATKD